MLVTLNGFTTLSHIFEVVALACMPLTAIVISPCASEKEDTLFFDCQGHWPETQKRTLFFARVDGNQRMHKSYESSVNLGFPHIVWTVVYCPNKTKQMWQKVTTFQHVMLILWP